MSDGGPVQDRDRLMDTIESWWRGKRFDSGDWSDVDRDLFDWWTGQRVAVLAHGKPVRDNPFVVIR